MSWNVPFVPFHPIPFHRIMTSQNTFSSTSTRFNPYNGCIHTVLLIIMPAKVVDMLENVFISFVDGLLYVMMKCYNIGLYMIYYVQHSYFPIICTYVTNTNVFLYFVSTFAHTHQ